MHAHLRSGLLMLLAFAASARASSDVVDHDLDAQVCEAAARTILAASSGSSPIYFVPGGDPAREGCIAGLLGRADRVLSRREGPGVLQVLLRGDEVHDNRFSTRLAISSYDHRDSAWTHAGGLEFTGGPGRWQFSRFAHRFIDGRRVR